ncbi:MAG TPA: hypothetical protein PJ997_01720 [Candidatus Paceibacterota bacterium]|nr:hypothetical protein [Candidatus Paceibacterota bacterium]HMP19036.1 hypothetical protein [Candidatus Paceibacterota bacterium]HMP85199.1 hypothetical protein [Candidatus Paceibacterota bacterium]
MKKVEQIDSDNNVIIDYDEKISAPDIKKILSKHFNVINDRNPFICFSKNNKKFFLCVKQITYLGNPHNIFKKRIQIPKEWKSFLIKKNTFLIGVYKYKSNIIFVFFDTKKYLKNNLNNSSAHVHTIDLRKAVEHGFFEKIDSRGNKIVAIKEEGIIEFIDNFFSDKKISLPKEIILFDKFSNSIDRHWNGIKCYSEMFNFNYKNAGQAEWPGFYLEFSFENFLNKNPNFKNVCLFVKNKKYGELDFDLNFSNNYLGDLKAHSNKTCSISGNDKMSFLRALNKYGKFWYIVFYHETKKDSDFKNEVTIFWNKVMNKKDLLSYKKRMKHTVILKNMKILEINKGNLKYISDLNQGKNSDGNLRSVKIQIKNNVVNNFLIFNKNLN